MILSGAFGREAPVGKLEPGRRWRALIHQEFPDDAVSISADMRNPRDREVSLKLDLLDASRVIDGTNVGRASGQPDRREHAPRESLVVGVIRHIVAQSKSDLQGQKDAYTDPHVPGWRSFPGFGVLAHVLSHSGETIPLETLSVHHFRALDRGGERSL